MVPEQRTCEYKVCHMVPEQRSRTVCYKVCHMVPEQRTCYLQGLPHGTRAAHPHGVLHGVQAGLLPTHHPGLEVCAEMRAIHRDPLRAALCVQASSSDRHDLLPKQLRL